jgi:hypothetical protein
VEAGAAATETGAMTVEAAATATEGGTVTVEIGAAEAALDAVVGAAETIAEAVLAVTAVPLAAAGAVLLYPSSTADAQSDTLDHLRRTDPVPMREPVPAVPMTDPTPAHHQEAPTDRPSAPAIEPYAPQSASLPGRPGVAAPVEAAPHYQHPDRAVRPIPVPERGQSPVEHRAPDGTVTRVHGSPQETYSHGHPTGHASRMLDKVAELIALRTYADIVMNRNAQNATGLASGEAGIAGGNKQIDISAIRHDGRVDFFEVQSPGNSIAELIDSMHQAQDFLPPRFRGGNEIVRLR